MAKKNRKLTKINQQIKKYFDGDPFDVGIERVSSEVLSELFATLGIYEIEHSKPLLLKTIRMIWSEADGGYRRDILNFFIANDIIYTSSHKKTKESPDESKEEKLLEIISQLEANAEEQALLYETFIQVKPKKITIEKIENKLNHIRFEKKKQTIEQKLDGFFELDDSFEFNASLRYKIYDQHFHKILTLTTKPYSYTFLKENSIEDIVQHIAKDKEEVTLFKQIAIEDFINRLKNPHDYLTQKEIEKALRAAPPKTKLSYPPLKADILQSILSSYVDIETLTLLDEEVVLEIKESIELPYTQKKHPYTLELHLELNSLLQTIWESQKIDLENIIKTTKEENETYFLEQLQNVVNNCQSYAATLHLTSEQLYEKVYEHLFSFLSKHLFISAKVAKKTLRTFIYHIQDEIVKQQRQTLLARTIRDFKNLFPLARSMKRKLTLHIGPTNSGKTYTAMQKLKNADTGYYLAPLRLLALEGYENLKSMDIDVSLITGEEQIINDDATHISSTIEMLNFEVDVDVCVIDEVQMIDDSQRGWAWANAIIGAPAQEIIMTGSANVKDAIIALAQYLGDELEIIEFERKTSLTLLEKATPPQDVEEGSAIIAFSRKDVLKLKQQFSSMFNVSVVYGNLSPEVRREEAKRFREKKSQILIATDAIAMGMNLPIQTILFSKAEKFDGERQRTLQPSEIAQIAGRAGRFGLSEEGFVGALTPDVLRVVKKNFYKEIPKITIPFKVMANLEHIKLVGNILEVNSLEEILNFFVENMKFNGPFHAANLEDMVEAAHIVDEYELDIATKYHLSCAPLTLKSPYIVNVFRSYLEALEKKEAIAYNPPPLLGSFAQTTDDMLRAEDMVKEISLYLWLSYRFDEYFPDAMQARQHRGVLNKYIEESLQNSHFVQRCRICGAPLPPNYPYNICQKCFRKNHRKNYSHGRNRRR